MMAEGVHSTTLFAQEHDIRRTAYAGDDVNKVVNLRTGLTVYSLYRKDSKRIVENMYGKGCRCYRL